MGIKKRTLLDLLESLTSRVGTLEELIGREPAPVIEDAPGWHEKYRTLVPVDVYLADVPTTDIVAHLKKRMPRREIPTGQTEQPKVVDGKVVW